MENEDLMSGKIHYVGFGWKKSKEIVQRMHEVYNQIVDYSNSKISELRFKPEDQIILDALESKGRIGFSLGRFYTL